MITAAKTVSQMLVHIGVGFGITYAVTGSVVFGGMVALLEPIINVALLPLHENLWTRLRKGCSRGTDHAVRAAQKCSQTLMHMGVAFAVMYVATGSATVGGIAAVLEPIVNVVALPFHDQAWEKLRTSLCRDNASHGTVQVAG